MLDSIAVPEWKPPSTDRPKSIREVSLKVPDELYESIRKLCEVTPRKTASEWIKEACEIRLMRHLVKQSINKGVYHLLKFLPELEEYSGSTSAE